MLRYLTSGESHGKCLVAILEGMVSGLKLNPQQIDKELLRRQSGYGRGGRMAIEADRVEILSGVRKDKTTGAPLCLLIPNKDYTIRKIPEITAPRPGHADLAGALKYNQPIRDVLERASARETAARVAVGAVCKALLNEFSIYVISHTLCIGGIWAETQGPGFEQIKSRAEQSDLNCADPEAAGLMRKRIDEARRKKDSLGGVFEVMAGNVPAGLGSFVHWDRKLDGLLARALMSIQSVKAVEIGLGFSYSALQGSQAHDEIFYKGASFCRQTNNAGGIEGGVSNGELLLVRCCVKPVPTLGRPLRSVDIETKKAVDAAKERADVCVVPAAGVIGEAVVAFELARLVLEKFGGDSLGETKRNYNGYLKQLKKK